MLKGNASKTRLFFATDIHGSEVCWRKFLNAGKHYDADVIVLGGDITGKALVPIVEVGDHWEATLSETPRTLRSEADVAEFEEAARRRGYYPFRSTPEEVEQLDADPQMRDELFRQHMVATVQRWMSLADDRLTDEGPRCYVCPGNDDRFEIDEVIASAQRVELAEGRVLEVDGFQIASTGWSNHTPWHSYREEDESELARRIESVVSQVTAPSEKTIYSFHCPPHGTGLDHAPELTEDLTPRAGSRALVSMGSTAVRDAIERDQPALSLHGHIHEARGTARLGQTLSINPGSSYEDGQLLGALIDLDGGKRVKRFLLTNG